MFSSATINSKPNKNESLRIFGELRNRRCLVNGQCFQITVVGLKTNGTLQILTSDYDFVTFLLKFLVHYIQFFGCFIGKATMEEHQKLSKWS